MDGDGGQDRQVLPLLKHGRRADVQSEPEQDLAEVVRVPADRPQSCVDEFSSICRISSEGWLLIVGHDFEKHAWKLKMQTNPGLFRWF